MGAAWRVNGDDDPMRVLQLEGELDLSVAEALENELLDALTRVDGSLAIDLTDVTYLDSSSVRALMHAVSAAAADDKTVRVVGASTISRRVLEISGIDGLLGLDPS